MKPNIIFLTVGCSNSTITMRMIEALGWNLGDADVQFAESVSVRLVNHHKLRGKDFNYKAAKASLQVLPQPWAIKDPRFAHTLTHWEPLLAPYSPLLLWVTKDMDYVRRSFQRRFKMNTKLADQRFSWCQEHFEKWKWQKLQVDADQITKAVKLFDPNRSLLHKKPTQGE